jgi:hypothetical protein
MTIIIEDGSIIEDANSYVTTSDVRAFASARGITFDNTDPEIEFLIVSATDYLESKRSNYQGSKVSIAQSLQFPREDVYIDGFPIDATAIPKLLKDAQCRLVIELASGVDLHAVSDRIKRKKVGPMETEYFEPSYGPSIPAVDSLLEPLFKTSGGGWALSTVRV